MTILIKHTTQTQIHTPVKTISNQLKRKFLRPKQSDDNRTTRLRSNL